MNWIATLRITCATAVSFGSLAQAVASAQVGVTWVEPTRGVSLALDAVDNVYTVDYEQALGAEMVLTKRDANGTLLWVKSYDQTSSTAWERASWVATDPAGNTIVCGTLMSGYSNPVEAASIVMKFNAQGSLLWRRVYESSFDGSSVRKCVVDANSNVYVLGMGSGPAGRVVKVKKFAPDGTALWSYFDAAGIGAAVNIKLAPDGNLLIAAKSIYGSYVGFAKIDATGNAIWSKAGIPSLTVGDSAGDVFGNTYLVHGEYVASGGTVIKKLNAAGSAVWERVYPMSGFRVEVGGDNNAVISGFPNVSTAGAAFMKVDAAGSLVWSNLDADGPLGLLAHSHMLLDRQNNAYLAAGTMSEMAVCKVNSDGTSGWTQTVAFGYAAAIGLGNTSDSVYVVGGTTARLGQSGTPTLPAAPSALTYGAVSATAVDLRWTDNASNENGFTLERCTGTLQVCGASTAVWALRATLGANVTAFSDSGLTPQTAYSWRVKAFNALGSSPASNYLSVTTAGSVPAAPTGLKAQAQRSLARLQVQLTWTDNATDETGYTVERCAGAACTNFAAIASLPANSASFVDASVVRGTTYSYRVWAGGSGGKSAYSNVATITAR
jgi:hypothetical protein